MFAFRRPGIPTFVLDLTTHWKSLNVTMMLLATVLSGSGSMANAAEPVGKKYVYKHAGDRELHLYVVEPDEKSVAPRPACVLFHGGGWTGGAPSQFDTLAKHLAQRGMVAVQVEYRLLKKADKDPPTVCVQDAKSAMRWVRSHAVTLHVNPQQIAAGGGSAGGHLAAFVGMVAGHDDPQDDTSVSCRADALLLFNPVFDNGPDKGWGTARVGDRYPEFSPAHNITADDPPAIVFLGTADSLIPVAVAERFRDQMKAVGVRCDLHLYDDQPHGFFNKEPFLNQTIQKSDAFLVSIGWISE